MQKSNLKPKSVHQKRSFKNGRLKMRQRKKSKTWLNWFKKGLILGVGGFGVLIISVVTPIFSTVVLWILNILPLPQDQIDPQHASQSPSAYLVLGGGLTKDSDKNIVLNDFSLQRVKTVKHAYDNHPLPIILSGVESPWLMDWLSEVGITQTFGEFASMNTCENARFSAKRLHLQKMPFGRVYLITDAYHMARARRQFAINGMPTTPLVAPLPQARSWLHPRQNLQHSRRAIYELSAYFRDIFLGQNDCRSADKVSEKTLSTPRKKVITF